MICRALWPWWGGDKGVAPIVLFTSGLWALWMGDPLGLNSDSICCWCGIVEPVFLLLLNDVWRITGPDVLLGLLGGCGWWVGPGVLPGRLCAAVPPTAAPPLPATTALSALDFADTAFFAGQKRNHNLITMHGVCMCRKVLTTVWRWTDCVCCTKVACPCHHTSSYGGVASLALLASLLPW